MQNPVWPAMQVCPEENLPAFETIEALWKFAAENGSQSRVTKVWRCLACEHWHYLASAPDPSGTTSGNSRTAKHRNDE